MTIDENYRDHRFGISSKPIYVVPVAVVLKRACRIETKSMSGDDQGNLPCSLSG